MKRIIRPILTAVVVIGVLVLIIPLCGYGIQNYLGVSGALIIDGIVIKRSRRTR